MFKATLIDNKNYYKNRRFLLLLRIFPPSFIFLFMLFNYEYFSKWGIILILILFIGTFIIENKILKSLTKIKYLNKIEISDSTIVISKKKGELIEKYELESIEKIIVKKEYQIANEKMKDILNEIKRKYIKNYIIIEKDNKKVRFDFTIDSYYMIEELKKLFAIWEQKAYNIKIV